MKKLYVLVRGDLSKSQQAVQAAHAVAELCLFGDRQGWDNGTVVILKVRDLAMLCSWHEDLGNAWKISCFYEPDIGNQMTALAFVAYDVPGFEGLPLL
jgi:hypothetical protein